MKKGPRVRGFSNCSFEGVTFDGKQFIRTAVTANAFR